MIPHSVLIIALQKIIYNLLYFVIINGPNKSATKLMAINNDWRYPNVIVVTDVDDPAAVIVIHVPIRM